jgi:hypothetical protein
MYLDDAGGGLLANTQFLSELDITSLRIHNEVASIALIIFSSLFRLLPLLHLKDIFGKSPVRLWVDRAENSGSA